LIEISFRMLLRENKRMKFPTPARLDLFAKDTKEKDYIEVVNIFACNALKMKTKAGWCLLLLHFKPMSNITINELSSHHKNT
jgi:hypothetical protein